MTYRFNDSLPEIRHCCGPGECNYNFLLFAIVMHQHQMEHLPVHNDSFLRKVLFSGRGLGDI